jgi:P-type Mg2+ transporter
MQGSTELQIVQREAQEPLLDHASGVQSLPLQDLFEQLHTSESGLTSQQAQRRLSEVGPNETVGVQRTTAIVQFLRLFLNPLIIILLLASVVSAFLGDVINGSIIVTMVLLGVSLNYRAAQWPLG